MDGTLYIKYTKRNSPNRPIDTGISTNSLDITLRPLAQNYFSESVASPGQIELSFSPADSSALEFRLEFFDKYLEWDAVKISGNDNPATPRTIIDMTVSPTIENSTSMSTIPVLRSLQSVSSPSTFVLEGQKVSTLPSGQRFSLSSGRALYTGNSSSTLSYTRLDTGLAETLTLDRFERYTFPYTVSGSVTSGKVYVLTPSG